MTSLAAIGYFLCGLGTGLIANGFILDRELRKPIGEDEPILSDFEEQKKQERLSGSENTKGGLRTPPRASQRYSESTNRTKYNGYFEETVQEYKNEEQKAEAEHPLDDDEEDAGDNSVDNSEDEDDHEMIFQITLDEYADAASATYDKYSIEWYVDDDTYTNAFTDEMLPAFTDHIGTKPLIFDADGLAYVRNENESADYEIKKIENSYVGCIMGINLDDESPKRKLRKMRDNEYD